ncbi:helix-turn-helix domain-containing protein [Anoxybacterium hadale]|uniref:helix-turn-helix domain-containing protein n=1 Tax=Anoxybacterium hadale TaxID=3408580 RepID=UPI003B00C9C1
MNSVELGRKIKEARITRKMTQSEVVGNFITRNMLSQIESGTATPSIKTLEYLSRVLDIPLFQLIPDQKDDSITILNRAKKHLAEGAYDKILKMEEGYPPELQDEFWAIFANASLKLAKQQLRSGSYQDAARLSQKAMEYAEKGIYANSTVKSESIIVLNQAAEKLRHG